MRVMDLLQRHLRDPRLVGVHVTRVDMAGDLSRATLWFRCTPGLSDRAVAQPGLKAATGFLRRELGKSLRLRTVPELVFSHDDVPEEGGRIDALLAELARDAAPPARESGDDDE